MTSTRTGEMPQPAAPVSGPFTLIVESEVSVHLLRPPVEIEYTSSPEEKQEKLTARRQGSLSAKETTVQKPVCQVPDSLMRACSRPTLRRPHQHLQLVVVWTYWVEGPVAAVWICCQLLGLGVWLVAVA